MWEKAAEIDWFYRFKKSIFPQFMPKNELCKVATNGASFLIKFFVSMPKSFLRQVFLPITCPLNFTLKPLYLFQPTTLTTCS